MIRDRYSQIAHQNPVEEITTRIDIQFISLEAIKEDEDNELHDKTTRVIRYSLSR